MKLVDQTANEVALNKWVILVTLAAGVAAVLTLGVSLIGWFARRYERAHDLVDRGASPPAASPIDHAMDQAHDDAHGHS